MCYRGPPMNAGRGIWYQPLLIVHLSLKAHRPCQHNEHSQGLNIQTGQQLNYKWQILVKVEDRTREICAWQMAERRSALILFLIPLQLHQLIGLT